VRGNGDSADPAGTDVEPMGDPWSRVINFTGNLGVGACGDVMLHEDGIFASQTTSYTSTLICGPVIHNDTFTAMCKWVVLSVL